MACHSLSQLRASHVASRVASSSQAWRRRRTEKRAILRLSLVSPCGCWAGSCLTFPPGGDGQMASAAADADAESRGRPPRKPGRRRRMRKQPILTLSPVSPCGHRPECCVTFPPGGIGIAVHVATSDGCRDGCRDSSRSCRALRSPGGLTGAGHQAGWCGRITLTGGGSILVAPGEPKSIRRNLPSAQVNGNARPGNWPGVFLSRCWKRVTVFPPPAPALSIPQARFWGPKAPIMVAPVARKNGRELSDSLVNRLKRVNSRVASGTYRHIELAPGT